MSVEAHRSVNGDTGESPEEAALARVLESYLAGLEAGRPADPDRLVAAHPELAGPLRACLRVMHLAAGLSDASDSPAGPSPYELDGDAINSPTVLWPPDGLSSHRLLPEPPDDGPPIGRVGGDVLPDSPDGSAAGRYQILGEIARGGMGVVLKARDVDLGRDLALKVLQSRHRNDPDIAGRFVEEARIGGQLQHPGIVPVHELGMLAGRWPYFTMKLVKGRTLAAILAERPGPGHELPRFLGIFEQVCQTVAYAHARRVIHRDLKPANVMVGSFGEVHVVDWGLAKVLAEGGVADEIRALEREETVIQTARSGPPGSGGDSQPGSVLGTPSYMAPEQARGELDRVDERADVFGLGAILCEILTGRPPFAGSTRDEIRAQAARGDVAGAMARLDACEADAELTPLARDCLAPELERRPRDAGEVARRMSAYQAGVQDRLRAAELARVAAQTRAEEERKRRRVTVALAASVLVIAGLAGGGWSYLVRQRLERSRQLDRASAGVESLYAEARRVGDDPARWAAAREAARALEVLLADAPDPAARARLAALAHNVTRADAAAWTDRNLQEELADIRVARGDDLDGLTTDARYAAAFRRAGMDVVAPPPDEAAARIAGRPPTVRLALATALDDWAAVRRARRHDEPGTRRLVAIARLVDPDPWRDRLRAILQFDARDRRLTSLKDLARSAELEEWPATSLDLLGGALLGAGDPEAAESVLRQALGRHPDDLWLNEDLARCLRRMGRTAEAIRYYTAMRAIRPVAAHMLAHRLEEQGEADQAIAMFRDLTRLRPGDTQYLSCLGKALKSRGRVQEASAVLEAAVARARAEIGRYPDNPDAHLSAYVALFQLRRFAEAAAEARAMVRLVPGSALAHNNLGEALSELGRPAEAITEFQASMRLDPDWHLVHYNLADELHGQGKPEQAIAEYRHSLRLDPDFAAAHNNLGEVLIRQGKPDEAAAEFREAIRIKPNHAFAHGNLAVVLVNQGKLDEALEELRAALRIRPDDDEAHTNLGVILAKKGRVDEAIAEYREAIRIRPDNVIAHRNLGKQLRDKGKLDAADDELRAALRIQPANADVHSERGVILAMKGNRDGAITEFREAIRLKPDYVNAHINLGNALREQRKLDAAVVELREAIRLKPDDAMGHFNLGVALRDQGRSAEAAAEYLEALRLKSDYAEAHSNLGGILCEQGKLDAGVDELRAALRIRPDYVETHYSLGLALYRQGKIEEAILEYREALRLRPDYVEAHSNLGVALRDQGRSAEAAAEYREALRLKPDSAEAHSNLGGILYEQGKLDAGLDELRAAIRIRPAYAEAHSNLGVILAKKGRVAEAIAEFREAIRIRPDNVDAHINLADTRFMRAEFDVVIAESRELLRRDPNFAIGHCNLGRALLLKGSYAEALAELRRGHELGSKQPGWRPPSAQWVSEAERMAGLEKKLPEFLNGKARPADPAESLVLAQMCYQKKLHSASARFWEEAFRARPELADDMQAQHRYNAACAAALAGCGQGKDDPPPDGAARTRRRKQAIGWLRSDVTAWSKILEGGPPQARAFIAQTLRHWKADPDLAGLRDPGPLARLSRDEQDACRALWKDVDALLAKAGGTAP